MDEKQTDQAIIWLYRFVLYSILTLGAMLLIALCLITAERFDLEINLQPFEIIIKKTITP